MSILIIAGSDSSGGAGLQRDLQVATELAEAALCAVTAVTAQSDASVHTIHVVPDKVVAAQIDAALMAPGLQSIKIGMLATEAVAKLVAARLANLALPVVVDPVLASSSGARLLDRGGQQVLLETLAPRITLLTPNVPEAALLLETQEARTPDQARGQALELHRLCGCAVLLKGGHLPGPKAIDYLVAEEEVLPLASDRVEGSMRGTGCALATAIAIYLGRGKGLGDAAKSGKELVTKKIKKASR